MSWRITPTFGIVLILVLSTLIGIAVAHAIAYSPITGCLHSFKTIIRIPPSYGPCKICRDLYISIKATTYLLFSNDFETWSGSLFQLYQEGKAWNLGDDKWGSSSVINGLGDEVWLLNPVKIYINGTLLELNLLQKTPQLRYCKRNIAGKSVVVSMGMATGCAGYVFGGEWWHSYTRSTSRYVTIDVDLYKERFSPKRGMFHHAFVRVGQYSVDVGPGSTYYHNYPAYQVSPILMNNTQVIEFISPVGTRPYEATYIKLTGTYYYTLVFGLLARAYWLNGTPVDLPSLGIVDGYVPTKYWRILKVYPASAFSRGHAVVLKDNYGYYIYYVVPNAVFHVVVGPGVLVFRVGRVGYVCKLRRDVLTVALPTDWNDTIEYICYSNLTRVHFVSVVEGVNSTLNVETIDVGMFVLDSSNYTFPRDFLMRPGSKHSIKLLNDTIRINATCILLLKPVRWDLYECARNDTLCSMNDYVFVKSLPISTTFDVGKRGLELIGIYRGVLECNRTVIKITSRPILGVSIYYMAEYNNTILTAGIGKTPFILVLPPGTYLTLIAPDTVKRGNITYRFSYWTGLAKSEITKITFKVNKSGTEIAYYVNASLRIGSALCPVVFVSSLSRVWSLMYSDSESAIVSKVGNVWELCECSCMYRVLCCPNESDGKCFWTSCGVTSCPAGYVVRDVVCCSFHKSCTGKSNDVISVTSSRALRDVSKRWVRVLEAGTLRLPVLDGSGWKMCAGLYLQSARLNVFSRTFLRSSVSMSTSLSMHCGCKVKISKKASAIASIVSLTINFLLQGRGNIPILDISRNIEHVFNIGKTVTVENGGSNSTSWNGDWRTSVERYNTYTTYDVYNIAGGRYRKSMIIAVSRYEPSSFLTSNVYLSLSITHKPDRFNCSCSRCGVSCTCSANVRTLAKAKATLTAKTSITGGELIIRAGLARREGGWLKPRFGELTCNDYGCIWYSNRDPWHHSGILSIRWSPMYPLPGQSVRIVVTFSTGDNQPVRLWVYRVVERYWSVSEQRWVTKRYRLYLYTPWEISQAPRGSASISFTWKMPNGYVTVCAAGWGVFTRLVEECWTITPGIIVWNVFTVYDYYVLTNDHAYAVVSGAILHGEAIHGPDLYYQYAIYATAYVSKCFNVKLKILDIDPSSIFLVRPRGLEVEYTHTQSTIYSLETCLSPGNYLILEPAGSIIRIGSIPSNRAVILDLGPNVPSLLVDRSALLGRSWTTYMVEVSFGQYYRIRRTVILSLIKHVPIIDWSTDMPKIWVIAEYVYHDVPVLGTWFNYLLKCSDNYTLSIMFSNVSLHRQIIPILNIELPPGAANNGPKVLEVSQDLLVGSCTLYVVDLPETSIPTTGHVADNYLKIYPAKSKVRIVSRLPIDHWTIYVIVDGELKKIINIGSRRSIVLYVRDFLKIRGHSIDVIVKAYPACIGLCVPIQRTVIIIRR